MPRIQKLTPPVIYEPCDFIADGMCMGMKPNRELTGDELDFIKSKIHQKGWLVKD